MSQSNSTGINKRRDFGGYQNGNRNKKRWMKNNTKVVSYTQIGEELLPDKKIP